jgi:hypothetical protein
MKPGFLTSEFFVTVLVAVLSGVTMLQPGMPWQGIVASLAIAGIKAAWYVSKRTELKLSANDAAPPPAGQ